MASTGSLPLAMLATSFPRTKNENGVVKTISVSPISHVSSGAIAVVECYNGFIDNYAQTDDATHTLPAAAAGMSFVVSFGTAVEKYFRIDPHASNSIYYEGITTGAGKYVGVAATVIGQMMQFTTVKVGAATWAWVVNPNFSGLVVEA